jgi:hypothetical protein
VNQAKTLYHDQTGKNFTYNRAWHELRDAPKWQATLTKTAAPNIIGTSDSATSSHPASAIPNTSTASTNVNEPSATQSNGARPIGVKAAKRALNQSELMSKKLKTMELSANDSLKINRMRHAEMSRANDIQERLVNMDIMSKDLSTCVDEFERTFFRNAKKKILEQMEEESSRCALPSDSQSTSDNHLDQHCGGKGTSISDSLESTHRDNLPSSEGAPLNNEHDKDGSSDKDNHNNHGACDSTTINPSIL